MFSWCVSSDVTIDQAQTAVACRMAKAFGVFTFTLTHLLAKTQAI